MKHSKIFPAVLGILESKGYAVEADDIGDVFLHLPNGLQKMVGIDHESLTTDVLIAAVENELRWQRDCEFHLETVIRLIQDGILYQSELEEAQYREHRMAEEAMYREQQEAEERERWERENYGK